MIGIFLQDWIEEKSLNKCELCHSQWGNYWKVFEDRKLFFCCQLCAVQYENLISTIQNQIENQRMSILEIKGTSRLRICRVIKNDKEYRFSLSFRADGQVSHFKEL